MATFHREPVGKFALQGRRFLRALSCCAQVAVLVGCGEDGSAASPQRAGDAGTDAGEAARFSPADCSEVRLADPDEGVECGWVTVPRDHGQPKRETLDLAVAVLKATGAQPAPDPIVFLQGGPGASGVERIFERYRSDMLAYWRKTRDVVLFDQRGTGANRPDLDCPEYDEAFLAAWSEPLSRDEEIAMLVEAMRACHARLVDAGVDLRVYTSAQSALDVGDIMRALGHSDYNLYGVSYGGRLALTVMRDAPEGVRSVVLDSPVPIGPKRSFAHNAEAAFKVLDAACTADSKCAATYPKLERTLAETATRLDREPLSVASTARDARPLIVNGPRALISLFGAMYVRNVAVWLPLAITQLSQGIPGVWGTYVNGYVDEVARTRYTEAMAYSILCSDDYPFESMTHGRDLAAVSAPYNSLDQFDFQTLGACAFWNVRAPDPKENETVRSDIPALILSGSLDPIAPHAYAEEIGKSLSRSQEVFFKGIGHGVVRTMTGEDVPRCAERMTQAFYDSPTDPLDTSCQADIPDIVWSGAL